MPTKRSVDETAFEDLTRADACYFVGLLASDGCVGGAEPTRISLKLVADDVAIIRLLRKFLGSNATISVSGPRGGSRSQAGIQIRSERLVEQLTSLGVGPRKSLSMRITSRVLLESRDFWRGVIDGDGTVMIAKYSKRNGRTYWYPRIQLVSGSEDFILQYSDFLAAHDLRSTLTLAPTQAADQEHMIYTCCVVNQSDVVRLATLLYDGCGVYALPRKYRTARAIMRTYAGAPKRKPIITPDIRREILELYARKHSSNRIASQVGLTTTAVTNVLKAAGVPIRSRSGNHAVKQYSAQEVIEAYGLVHSTRRAAVLVGLSRDTVRKVLKEHGVL